MSPIIPDHHAKPSRALTLVVEIDVLTLTPQ